MSQRIPLNIQTITIWIDALRSGSQTRKRRIILKRSNLPLDSLRQGNVIRIHPSHQFGPRSAEKFVPRGNDTEILAGYETHAHFAHGEALKQFRRSVVGPVVYHDELEVRKGLSANAVQCGGKITSRIEYGH